MATTFGTLAVPSAHAALYIFDCITNNNSTNCTTGENQLRLDVESSGNTVSFELSNLGPLQSTIKQVFFDDSGVLNGAVRTISDPFGVDFDSDNNPGNLPGGNSLSPQFVTSWSFSADNPPPTWGVNPGEWVKFSFTKSGLTLNNVLADLNDGDLRVGLHMINYANGGSESFVNVPAIPEPGTLGLLGAGLLGLLGVARRSKVA